MNETGDGQRTLRGRRIMVTGAGGFIGSHLVERLLREEAEVGALDLAAGRLDGLGEGGGLSFTPCDLADATATQKAILDFGPEILIHLAAAPDGREDFNQVHRSIRENLLLTVNALEGLRLAGGEVFVYGDSSKVYGDCAEPYHSGLPERPLSSYGIAKSAGWQYCLLYERLHGLCCVSLRPTMIYGPRQAYNLFNYVAACVHRGLHCVELDGGDQTRDPLYIDDAIEAYLRVAHLGRGLSGRTINIGGGEEHSVLELAQLAAELLESPARVVAVANRRRPTEMRRSICDNSEAGRLLDWRPRVGLREGLRRTLADLAATVTPEIKE